MKRNAKIVLSRAAKRKRAKKFEYKIESTLPGFKWITAPSSINPGGFVWREVAISDAECEISISSNSKRKC